ncbi:MAG: hypothetical protein ACR2KG_04180 [Nocardioidaceae bacterium]
MTPTGDEAPRRGLLDTSGFIAQETGRPLDVDGMPDEVGISVITLAELETGVLVAADAVTRAARLATLDVVSDLGSFRSPHRSPGNGRCFA